MYYTRHSSSKQTFTQLINMRTFRENTRGDVQCELVMWIGYTLTTDMQKCLTSFTLNQFQDL